MRDSIWTFSEKKRTPPATRTVHHQRRATSLPAPRPPQIHTASPQATHTRSQGVPSAQLAPMATSSSPRLLSSFLGDRLLSASARPLLRGAAPGRRPSPILLSQLRARGAHSLHLANRDCLRCPSALAAGKSLLRLLRLRVGSLFAGSRRAAYQATRTLCNLVDILFNR